jgi:hypothetical protein
MDSFVKRLISTSTCFTFEVRTNMIVKKMHQIKLHELLCLYSFVHNQMALPLELDDD